MLFEPSEFPNTGSFDLPDVFLVSFERVLKRSDQLVDRSLALTPFAFGFRLERGE